MENQTLVMANEHSENNQSITGQQQKKQSGDSQNASQAKTFALVDGLTLLGTVFGESLTPEHYEVYASVLGNLSPDELQYGFNRALRETKWWPKPSELLEFCTGRASAMADKLTIDRAWNFVRQYIEWFGVTGKTRWLLQGRFFNSLSFEAAVSNDIIGTPFAVTAPFYEVNRYDPPEIPDAVKQTLIAMAGTLKQGLTRIANGMHGWDSRENCSVSAKETGFIRKDFDEHCSRVLAAYHANSPKTINPTLQLPGKTESVFPGPTKTVMAYRIRRTSSRCEALRLTLDEATALHDEGTLSEPLYAETVNHYRRLEREEEWRNTPRELNAVFLRSYDRNSLPATDRDSWPPLGMFNIEDASGTRVLREYLPMAIGSLSLAIGDSIRFMGKLSELRFSERPRYVFDLNNAVINNNKEK